MTHHKPAENEVTDSCGCVFCDLGVERVEARASTGGFRYFHHMDRADKYVECGHPPPVVISMGAFRRTHHPAGEGR